jgi:hypothetical protein
MVHDPVHQAHSEGIESKTASAKGDDDTVKVIMKEIESGGPSVMIK